MKDLVKTILERGGDDETVTMPEWCDIVKISPNDFDGSVSFLNILLKVFLIQKSTMLLKFVMQ